MASSKRRVVKFKTKGDALSPKKTGWGAVLQAAMPIEVPAKRSVIVNLQTECDTPLFLVPSSQLTGLMAPISFVLPDQPIRVVLLNDSDRSVSIEARQVVGYVIPLGEDFDVEVSEG